jgi:hypothetical protein
MSWIQEWEERRQKVKELSKQKMAQVKENPVCRKQFKYLCVLIFACKYIQQHFAALVTVSPNICPLYLT